MHDEPYVWAIHTSSLLLMPTLCSTLDRMCDWMLAYLSVYVCILCTWVCVWCAGLIAAQRAMCGRGSSHVLRPSALLSILVGALACGGSTRVTGKQQSTSCERACSGKIPSVSHLDNEQCSAYKVPILFLSVQELWWCSYRCGADDIHNENVLLGKARCSCKPFGLCEQFQ